MKLKERFDFAPPPTVPLPEPVFTFLAPVDLPAEKPKSKIGELVLFGIGVGLLMLGCGLSFEVIVTAAKLTFRR